MKKLLAILAISGLAFAAWSDGEGEEEGSGEFNYQTLGKTNEVLMVDQDGNYTGSGLATMTDVATNAANVAIALAKAEIAAQTAIDVTNAVQAVVDNIMSNRVIVYRRGYADSFSTLTVITESDTCTIINADWKEQSANRIVVDIQYVTTAQVDGLKPNVYVHDTLAGGKPDFELISESCVSDPYFTTQEMVFGGQTYSGFFTCTVTIPTSQVYAQYFLFIKLEGNTPGGTGATLILKNGIAGGLNGTFQFGDKYITFTNGMGKVVTNAPTP